MPMISYAQNAEDVILARALRGTERGFYVDVGAASPNEATVTRHFYEAGWSGINIEPLPEWASELRQFRPRDINLEVASAASDGEFTFFRVREDPALSTMDLEIADEHRRAGLHVDELRIAVRTLNAILEEQQVPVIDFLKIDVEGAELEVLRGLDLNRWRPRVIVVESTLPTTLIPNHEEFDAYLVAGRYEFAASDGVNRYYARAEESDELVPFLVPANSTDDYLPLREYLLEEEIVRLRAYISHLEHDLQLLSVSRAELVTKEQSRGEEERLIRAVSSEGSRISIDRIAVCTSPLTGGGKLAALIGQALGVTPMLAEHPADIDLGALADVCVIELPWRRSEKLRASLASNGFQVVTVLRHPFDTLLAYLHLAQVDMLTARFLGAEGGDDKELLGATPSDERFVSWAVGPRATALLDISASWHSEPSVSAVDYERLTADGVATVRELLTLRNFQGIRHIAAPRSDGGADLEVVEGGWSSMLTEDVIDQLAVVLGPVAIRLGFETRLGTERPVSLESAVSAWQSLVGSRKGEDA